ARVRVQRGGGASVFGGCSSQRSVQAKLRGTSANAAGTSQFADHDHRISRVAQTVNSAATAMYKTNIRRDLEPRRSGRRRLASRRSKSEERLGAGPDSASRRSRSISSCSCSDIPWTSLL